MSACRIHFHSINSTIAFAFDSQLFAASIDVQRGPSKIRTRRFVRLVKFRCTWCNYSKREEDACLQAKLNLIRSIRSSKITPDHPPSPFSSSAVSKSCRCIRFHPRHALADAMPFSSPVSSAPFLFHPARHVDIATVVYRIMQQTTGPPVVNRVQRHSEYRDSRRVAERGSWPTSTTVIGTRLSAA